MSRHYSEYCVQQVEYIHYTMTRLKKLLLRLLNPTNAINSDDSKIASGIWSTLFTVGFRIKTILTRLRIPNLILCKPYRCTGKS